MGELNMSIRKAVRSHGSGPTTGHTGARGSSNPDGSASSAASPAAIRATRESRIKDPKLVTGVALVALSMILGSWIVSSADQRTSVWALKAPLAAGSVLGTDDLVATPVNLETVGSYIGAEEPVDGMRLTRDIGGGELLPGAAVAQADQERRLVTIPVGMQHGAVTAARGDKVDVHVSQKDASGDIRASKVVLSSAVIAEISQEETGNGEIPVVLDVHPDQVPALVGALRGGVLDIVKVAGAQR